VRYQTKPIMLVTTTLCLVGAVIFASCNDTENQSAPRAITPASPTDSTLQEDLVLVGKARIYFNHMSVGDNVLAGLEKLREGIGTVRLHKVDKAEGDLGPSFFAHSTLGQNGAPKSKIDAFARYVDKKVPVTVNASVESTDKRVLMPNGLNVALMKLCFVDIDNKTDIVELFGYYNEAIAQLEMKHPEIAFAHVTVPLTIKHAEAAWKDFIKGIIGWKDEIARANIKRGNYNDFIRQKYPRGRIFDLALIESTRPDGSRESFRRYGMSYQSLFPGYTNDGGHLSGQIRERAARELVRTIAQVLREKGALAK
jgi:hypothetical protein